MATRATYAFHNLSDGHTTTFYIHWDGYPEGAADYMQAMVDHLLSPDGHGKGGFAEAFLRANLSAEITPSHDRHGDTEYRYDLYYGNKDGVNGHRFECHEIRWTNDEKRVSKCIFSNTLAEFLNQYKYNGFVMYRMWRGSPVTSEYIQGEYYKALMHSLRWWLSGHSGNAGVYGFEDLTEDELCKMDYQVFRMHKALKQVNAHYWPNCRSLDKYKTVAAAFNLQAHELLIAELLEKFTEMSIKSLWDTLAAFDAMKRKPGASICNLDNDPNGHAQAFLIRCEHMDMALETLRETAE